MQKSFKVTRSWATVLTTQLGVLNMHCRVGIAIPVPLHTIGGHGTLQKYRGTGTLLKLVPRYWYRYFQIKSTAVLLRYFFKKLKEKKLDGLTSFTGL